MQQVSLLPLRQSCWLLCFLIEKLSNIYVSKPLLPYIKKLREPTNPAYNGA